MWYELRDSVFSKLFGRAEELLQASPRLSTMTNSIGETVLHYLAVENDIEGVAWLHDHGFNLNTRTGFGSPLVFEVAELGHRELLLWMSANGADFSVSDGEGRGIVDYLLDGLDQELLAPSKEERTRAYWCTRRDTIQVLIEHIPGISLTGEQSSLFSALNAREAK